MKALIDTNIVLEDALAREPFAAEAYRITEACARGDVDGYLSAITPLNAFYVAHKTVGNDGARKMVAQQANLVLEIFKKVDINDPPVKKTKIVPRYVELLTSTENIKVQIARPQPHTFEAARELVLENLPHGV